MFDETFCCFILYVLIKAAENFVTLQNMVDLKVKNVCFDFSNVAC